MDVLVRLDDSRDVEEFLAKASWYGVDGLEIDISSLSEGSYHEVRAAVREEGFPVRSVHNGSTGNVSMQDRERFDDEVEKALESAEELGAGMVSVPPPKLEQEDSTTVRDFQRFIEEVDRKAGEKDVKICFVLEGVLKESDILGSALENLENPSTGVMVDIRRLPDGLNPEVVMGNIEVPVWKVLVPFSVEETREALGDVEADITAVAERLE